MTKKITKKGNINIVWNRSYGRQPTGDRKLAYLEKPHSNSFDTRPWILGNAGNNFLPVIIFIGSMPYPFSFFVPPLFFICFGRSCSIPLQCSTPEAVITLNEPNETRVPTSVCQVSVPLSHLLAAWVNKFNLNYNCFQLTERTIVYVLT